MPKTRSTNIVTMDGNEDTIFNTVGLTDTYFEGKIMAKELASGDTLRIRVYNRNDGVSYYPFDSDVNDYCGSNNGTITYNTNLKRLYKFEGNVNDSTTKAANGTVSGNTNFVTGREGQAFSFDGSSYITASDTGLPTGNNPVSMSCWVNPAVIGVNQGCMSYGTLASNQSFAFRVGAANVIVVTTDTFILATGTTPISANTWYHVVVTWDGTNCKIYVNGVLDVSSTPPTLNLILAGASGIVLGAFSGPVQQLNGKLDECRIYSGTVLSAAQVSALYMNGKFGQSHTFDGGEYISLGNPTNLQFERTNAFSISYWVKYTSNAKMKVITKNNGDSTTGYEIGFNSLGFPILRLINTASTNEINVVGTASYDDGAYHHICWTYSGSSAASGVKLYVDNTAISLTTTTDNLSATIVNTNNVLIGSDGGGANYLIAQIDDGRIYNRALSTSDVTDLYNNPAPMKSVLYDKSYSGPLSPTTCIYVPYITSNQYTLTAQQTTSTYYKSINGELYSVT